MPCAVIQAIRRFTSPITSGPMPSPGRSSSLWVAMIALPFEGYPMRGVLMRRCANGKTPLPPSHLCKRSQDRHMRPRLENEVTVPEPSRLVDHPARLILILSLAPTVGLGIGRFAYSLVLPDMRDTLGWSYSAAGFMNTINAAGYLAGALMAARIIRRFGLALVSPLGNAGLRTRAGAERHL